MTSPLPPDQGASAPDGTDSAEVDAEVHDPDTGPLHVAGLPPGEGAWTNYFDSSVLVNPQPVRHGRPRLAIIGAVCAAVLIVVAAVGFWMLRPASTTAGEPNTGADETAESPTPDPEAATRLFRLIPPGYPAGACTTVTPPKDALAKLDCQKNVDPGGPATASYTLLSDKVALRAAFDGVVRGTRVVNCPRNMQSPGPWRRNATPQLVSGTLVCGFAQTRPTVAWTDEIALVLNTVESAPPGPNLDQLYDWWSTHS
jgi:hypothetical protein